jgi:hypothetical protein
MPLQHVGELGFGDRSDLDFGPGADGFVGRPARHEGELPEGVAFSRHARADAGASFQDFHFALGDDVEGFGNVVRQEQDRPRRVTSPRRLLEERIDQVRRKLEEEGEREFGSATRRDGLQAPRAVGRLAFADRGRLGLPDRLAETVHLLSERRVGERPLDPVVGSQAEISATAASSPRRMQKSTPTLAPDARRALASAAPSRSGRSQSTTARSRVAAELLMAAKMAGGSATSRSSSCG